MTRVVDYVSGGRVSVVNFMQSLQKSFDITEQQTGDPVEKGFDRDRDNPAMVVKATRERCLVKNERRFGSEQGTHNGIGKCSYLDRELRERQPDERNQDKESGEKKEEHGPGGDKLTVQEPAYSGECM